MHAALSEFTSSVAHGPFDPVRRATAGVVVHIPVSPSYVFVLEAFHYLLSKPSKEFKEELCFRSAQS